MQTMKEIKIDETKKSTNIIVEFISRSKIYRGLKNFWLWFKVIWEDRQWDYNFIIILLHRKFELMEAHYKGNNICSYVGEETDLENIVKVKDALKRLEEDNYWDETKDFKEEMECKQTDLDIVCDIIRKELFNWWD